MEATELADAVEKRLRSGAAGRPQRWYWGVSATSACCRQRRAKSRTVLAGSCSRRAMAAAERPRCKCCQMRRRKGTAMAEEKKLSQGGRRRKRKSGHYSRLETTEHPVRINTYVLGDKPLPWHQLAASAVYPLGHAANGSDQHLNLDCVVLPPVTHTLDLCPTKHGGGQKGTHFQSYELSNSNDSRLRPFFGCSFPNSCLGTPVFPKLTFRQRTKKQKNRIWFNLVLVG